ncbi:CIS tube protein [Lunatibacter salilacus]|uniref:CIS tube protein n=1 Tax=Lunatibacter salilacus TaxID=2483804 RepID=UPI00131C8C15|nr:LysM peptidoglycan-binding domain-containing protein [Lunatibacter salilacus]
MIKNPFDSGSLEKMYIQVVEVDSNGKIIESEEEELKFNVQVNPESYNFNYKVNYSCQSGHGDTNCEAKHAGTEPHVMEFEFLFDGTGVIPKAPGPLTGVPLAGALAELLSGEKEDDVVTQLKRFIKVVDYKGKDHRPSLLKLAWGKLSFIGVLTRLSIQYKLFTPTGDPLRALANATFTSSIPDQFRKLLDQDSSPDLTHLRLAHEGDKLPLMVNKIYRSTKYYIEVAKANNLYNFRNLKAGTPLSLPPIEKKVK